MLGCRSMCKVVLLQQAFKVSKTCCFCLRGEVSSVSWAEWDGPNSEDPQCAGNAISWSLGEQIQKAGSPGTEGSSWEEKRDFFEHRCFFELLLHRKKLGQSVQDDVWSMTIMFVLQVACQCQDHDFCDWTPNHTGNESEPRVEQQHLSNFWLLIVGGGWTELLPDIG